ncbi:uncharacterized protein LOC127749569 [Frankliniella occidentalis]|uniref:Uncharacterized protein LOC127749569 n=1 Tax=Frankliniella occidentalis TaxID=133901 RepID=A0A9C6X055_FRAOC|nr:uncharacterized protein LOC127749569 [Frankliniella occidentalis]
MEADWPADCRFPQLSRRRCRCESKASSRWRSRPSRHCPRSWVVSPAQGVVQGGVGMGGGAGVGCGLGVCPRPASADPGPRPHVSRRPSTAPASGAHSAPTRSGSVSGGRRRTAVLGPTPMVPVPPVLPEYPEEQLESWTLDNTPLKGAMESPNVCAVARGRMWHGEDGGRGAAPVDDDAVDNLREARVVDNSWSRPPPAATPRVTAHRPRPPTMDDGSVRSSVITAASAACSSIATSSSTPITSRTNSGTVTATSGTAPTTASSQATSRTASLEHPYPYHTTVPETVLECIDDLDSLDPLAVKTFHDDSQGSDIVLPVRAEAGTDPVAELDEGLQGLYQLSTPVGERARKRRKDARRRPPARYRVPLYEYHPTLQALQGSVHEQLRRKLGQRAAKLMHCQEALAERGRHPGRRGGRRGRGRRPPAQGRGGD